jgi:hypothetical protein
MADNEEQKTQAAAGVSASSAPELPHDIAKQYGLHHVKRTPASKEVAPNIDSDAAAPQENVAPEDTPATEDGVLDDEKTDAAVDDILTKEADDLLAMQSGLPPANQTNIQPSRRKHFLARWWHNKVARNITIIILLLAIAALAIVPQTRYVILNSAGVRSSASVVVLDNTTSLPLRNVSVELGAMSAVTDGEGRASFKDLKLGDYSMNIKRVAFAPYEQRVTIGWGSNPLGSYKLRATGTQYTILVTDFVSGKPIQGIEANSDEAVAQSDKNGKIILTVDDTEVTKLAVKVSGKNYRTESIEVFADSKTPSKVVLVPAGKDVYVSKQSGKYDVFASDLDGKNRTLLLAGSGNENATISLVVSPDGNRAALVSTRDNMRDQDGFLMQALTIINIEEGTSVTIDHAEQIQLVDWVDNRLVYRLTLSGASAANAQRSRLVSYNYDSNARVQLANANQFNAIVSSRGYVYYTISSTDPDAAMGLFKVKTDGSDRKRLTNDEIWTAIRTTYSTLSLQQPDGWMTYDLETGQVAKSEAPANVVTYTFTDATKGGRSLWTDVRDGKGALLLHDIDKNSDKVITRQEGLVYPVRWINDNTIVYRVSNSSETANYVVSLAGGAARKVSDVTPTYGYAQIY